MVLTNTKARNVTFFLFVLKLHHQIWPGTKLPLSKLGGSSVPPKKRLNSKSTFILSGSHLCLQMHLTSVYCDLRHMYSTLSGQLALVIQSIWFAVPCHALIHAHILDLRIDLLPSSTSDLSAHSAADPRLCFWLWLWWARKASWGVEAFHSVGLLKFKASWSFVCFIVHFICFIAN